MIKYLVSLIVVLCTVQPLWCSDKFVKSEFVTFAGLELHASIAKSTVFAVQLVGNKTDNSPLNDWIPAGTGFFVRGKDKKVYGVTCDHVIRGPLQRNQQIFIAMDTDKGFIRVPVKILRRNSEKDIAILRPIKVIPDASKITSKIWGQDQLLSKSLKEGYAVIIPGYPLGLGSFADVNSPVVRVGIIAQYSRGDHFLIDGFASHGNSGSPVYLNKKIALAGMIVSYMNDFISLKDDNGQVVAKLPYNSGLGRAIKADAILECLNLAVENSGIETPNKANSADAKSSAAD
jgi:hypothetical protein